MYHQKQHPNVEKVEIIVDSARTNSLSTTEFDFNSQKPNKATPDQFDELEPIEADNTQRRSLDQYYNSI